MGRDAKSGELIRTTFGFESETLLVEDCEGANNWSVSGTGAGYGLNWAASCAKSGEYGAELFTRIFGAAADDTVLAERRFGWPEQGQVVVRLGLWWTVPSLVKTTVVALGISQAGGVWTASVRANPYIAKLDYLGSGGSYTVLSDRVGQYASMSWYVLEFAVDLTLKEWLWIRWEGVLYDMTGVALRKVSSTGSRGLSIGVETSSVGAACAVSCWDDLMVRVGDIA